MRLVAVEGGTGASGAAPEQSRRRATPLELIEAVYSAALDERRWWLALRGLASALAARRVLLVERVGDRRFVLAASDLAAAGPEGRRAESRLELSGGSADAVEVALGEEAPELRLLLDRGPLDAVETELLRLLAPHLIRAWRVTHTLAEAERRLRLTGQALDRLATGVALVDAAGGVLAANVAAVRMLGCESEIRIDGGRLVAREPALARRLATALLRLAGPHADRSLPAEVLRLPSDADEPRLELLLLPLPPAPDGSGSPAALFVYEPAGAGLAPADLLERIYGLTPAESRVVGRILVGRTLEESARDLGIGRETARTHLKRIFRKVGTTRQTDLVRLLLTGPARVTWP